jgi:hypothetical protein
MLTALLLLSHTAAAKLPAWAVDQLERALTQRDTPPLLAAAGPGAEALAIEIEAALRQPVQVIRGPDPLQTFDAMLAVHCSACGYLLTRSEEGTHTLRRRGECEPVGSERTPDAQPTRFELRPPSPLKLRSAHGVQRAHNGFLPLDADEFAHLVGDDRVTEAYARKMRLSRTIGIGLVATGAASMGIGYVSATGSHRDDPGADERFFWFMAGNGLGMMIASPITIWARKQSINRLDHWYTPEEAERWVEDYNARLSGE